MTGSCLLLLPVIARKNPSKTCGGYSGIACVYFRPEEIPAFTDSLRSLCFKT
jgi:hypothetical protein